jgi:hypothetical protein
LFSVTDHGFTILLAQPLTFDLTFAWKAEASVVGNTVSFSDHTSAGYDVLIGPSIPAPVMYPVIYDVATSSSVTDATVTDGEAATSSAPVSDTGDETQVESP